MDLCGLSPPRLPGEPPGAKSRCVEPAPGIVSPGIEYSPSARPSVALDAIGGGAACLGGGACRAGFAGASSSTDPSSLSSCASSYCWFLTVGVPSGPTPPLGPPPP